MPGGSEYGDDRMARRWRTGTGTFLVVLVFYHRKLFFISRDHFNIAYAVAQLDKTAMAIDRQSLMLCEFTSDPFVPPARQNLEIFLKCFQSQGDYTLHRRDNNMLLLHSSP